MISKGMLNTLWGFRGFVLGSVRREFQLRYRGTMLGIAWTVLQPLAMILIYTVIFSQVMQAKLPGVDSTFAYSIYLCAGIITWGLFAEIIQRSQSVFIDNGNLLKKLSFPKLTLPVIVVITALLNFTIIFTLFVVFLMVTGNFPGVTVLAMIPLLILQVLFSAGIGITLGVLNVFFRDVGQLSNVLLQLWFWGTPIVYPSSILPEWLMPIMNINPMYHLMNGYQSIFVLNQWPQWQALTILSVISLTIALFALRLFRRHVGEMVDEL